MKTLKIDVVDKVATYQARCGVIICGNSDYQITFAFDSEWDAHEEKTARFIWNSQYYDVEFTGNTCNAPVISNATSVEVGVYAGDLRTTTSAVIECVPSVLCKGGAPHPETGQHYSAEAVAAAEAAKVSEVNAKASEALAVEKASSAAESAYVAQTSAQASNIKATEAAQSATIAQEAAELATEKAEQMSGVVQTTGNSTTDVMSQNASSYAFANAIKGKQSGGCVRCTDVSPVAHPVRVKVRSKNLWNNAKFGSTPTSTLRTRTETGFTFTRGDSTSHFYAYYVIPLRKGETATFSCVSEFTAGGLWIFTNAAMSKKLASTYNKTLTYTANADYPNATFAIYIDNSQGDTEVSNIQVEVYSDDALQTNYTPFIADGTSVTVQTCRKNLLTYPYESQNGTVNGITRTVKSDGSIKMSGTNTLAGISNFYLAYARRIYLAAGTYTISHKANGDKSFVTIAYGDGYKYCWNNQTLTFTIPNNYSQTALFLSVREGVTVDETAYIQLERGDTATDYETYSAGENITTTVGASVTVNPIGSTMNVLVPTDGVVVDVDYNKDTEAVFQKLVDAIISLGGNV